MKILVLGSHGIIGSGLCRHLKEVGHEVIPWDIKITPMHNLSETENMNRLTMLYTMLILCFSLRMILEVLNT